MTAVAARRTGVSLADAARVAETAAAFLGLLLISQALLGKWLGDPADPTGDAGLRLIWPPLYAFALIGLAARPAAAGRTLRAAWPLLLPVAVAAASALWSIDPGVSLRRAVAFAMTTVFGLHLAARFSPADLVRLLGAVFAVLLAASAAAALAAPGFGVMQEVHPGAWSGLWFEKNALGGAAARGGALFLALALFDARRRTVWVALTALAVAVLVLSQSKTAAAAFLAGAGVIAVFAARRLGPSSLTTVLGLGAAAAVTAAFIAFAAPEIGLAAAGRDATLTGRTELWAGVLEAVAARPWSGYGYGVFWIDAEGPAALIREAARWQVTGAHNGWLETALGLGVIGVAAAAACVLWAAGVGLAAARRGLTVAPFAVWLTLLLVFNVAESTLLERHTLSWTAFVALAAGLAAALRADRGARP